ncbi:MAG: hypothetical protein J2P45_24580 [Candidatus Dormibacteraeota bacterium]|nr:hypothetical protein [Candidatus Dormibacteraeota bacterium]
MPRLRRTSHRTAALHGGISRMAQRNGRSIEVQLFRQTTDPAVLRFRQLLARIEPPGGDR